MKKTLYISVAVLALLFTSCVKDMDKVVLSDTAYTPDKAWSDEATYQGFLAKIYAGFSLTGNQGPYGYDDISNGDTGETAWLRSWFTLQEFCTDEMRVFWDNDALNDLQALSWSSDNNWFRLTYDRMYLTIAYCNEYLRETTTEKMNSRGIRATIQENVKNYRAEVRLIRAMNYYFLMDFYGNIPIIVEQDGVGDYAPAQKSRVEVFNWIEGEVNAVVSEGNLPATGLYGRVNNSVAAMLLAKMYLNAEVYTGTARYTDCITQLNKVIGGGYSLEPVYKNLFGADNNNSKEVIFPIIYDGKKATGYGGVSFIIGLEASLKVPGLPIFDIYGVDGATCAWTGARAPKELFGLFSAEDKRALFYKEGMTDEITDLHTGYTQGRLVTKFTNRTSTGSTGTDQIFPDTDFPLFRLADAYLMYAEAVVRGGQGGDMNTALGYVNALRDRAGAAQVAQADLTLDFFVKERARELYWEGWRRSDLIRFNYFTANYNWCWKGGTQTGIANHDPKYNLYPLPAGELSVNTNLKQNQGY
ncbi:MAG: RagB/SusD family nutrient uptake outer membrane protein [Paludibacteraceae bacterium]|nr:RagB/SusD family nutrient uptake outer membrane protein [Paludibacteraceae bacterium]